MNRNIKDVFANIAIGMIATSIIYLVGVGIYTLIYGNSFFYNAGYALGSVAEVLSNIF